MSSRGPSPPNQRAPSLVLQPARGLSCESVTLRMEHRNLAVGDSRQTGRRYKPTDLRHCPARRSERHRTAIHLLAKISSARRRAFEKARCRWWRSRNFPRHPASARGPRCYRAPGANRTPSKRTKPVCVPSHKIAIRSLRNRVDGALGKSLLGLPDAVQILGERAVWRKREHGGGNGKKRAEARKRSHRLFLRSFSRRCLSCPEVVEKLMRSYRASMRKSMYRHAKHNLLLNQAVCAG